MMKREDYLGGYNYERYQDVYTLAKNFNHKHWIGDVPVGMGVAKFFNELKFKRPDVVLRVDKRPARYNGMEYMVFADVGIAFKEAPEINCGYIGMDTDKDRNTLYTVTSDRIKNEKYATHSDGYRIKSTKNFANAVKNAVQYIKPMAFDEAVDNTEVSLGAALNRMREPSHDRMYIATSMNRSVVEQEIRNMLTAGYMPTTAEFKQALQLIEAEGEELKRVINYKPRKCFVWAKPDRVEYQVDGDEKCIAFNLQDVPEHIRDKVAVLQISDGKSAIMDVGYKVSDSMYWVFV